MKAESIMQMALSGKLDTLGRPAPGRGAPTQAGVSGAPAPAAPAASGLTATAAPPQQTDDTKAAEFRRLVRAYKQAQPSLTPEEIKRAALGAMKQRGWLVE